MTTRPRRIWDIVLTIVLLVVAGTLTYLVSLFGLFLSMASDPCGAVTCNTSLIGAGVLIAATLPSVILLLTVVTAIILLVARRVAFWVPLAALPIIVVPLLVGGLLVDLGVPG